MFRLFLALPIVLATCMKDETISGFVDPTATYTLVEINGAKFTATATIAFPDQGSVNGKGPCNGFFTSQIEPYPWFKLGPIAATRSVCPDIALETEYFAQLGTMTQIEASGDVLILRNDAGDQMVFQASPV